MSGTSVLLNLLEGSGSALLNAPEAAQTGVSDADSSYFVSLMKQYEGSEGLDEASAPGLRDPALELLGNGLPIPVASPVILPTEPTAIPWAIPSTTPATVMLPAAVEAEADTRLEEFAVGLGIDRELARLLLRETSTPSVPGAAELPVMSLQPMATQNALDAGAQSASPLTTSPPIVPSASTTPRASTAPLLVESTIVPPADPSPTPRSEIPVPRAADVPLTNAGNAAPALRDEDVLRWRAFVHRSSSGVREPAQEIALQAASDEMLDPVSGSPRRGLSEVDFAAATASLRGFALERRQILTSTTTPVSSTALNGVLPGESPVNLAVLPVAASTPPSVPVTAQADPLTTPLRVPDPALQHELRAEQFAEQVGRRLLQQIREDRWTVNLQLDPQRLGPMEIELQLEGNQVTAQVGVANAEVRHLLESALPKLRESLDSAGLNLANWSFAQSGAREYREFAQQSAAAAAKSAPKAVDVAIEDEVPRRVTEDSASRVVDVYV